MIGDLSIACKLQEKHVYSLHPGDALLAGKTLVGQNTCKQKLDILEKL